MTKERTQSAFGVTSKEYDDLLNGKKERIKIRWYNPKHGFTENPNGMFGYKNE